MLSGFYGFYLIYHLTHDVAVFSHSLTRFSALASDVIPRVTGDLRDLSSSIVRIESRIR